jgi:predicted N-formylglutamate amidohydrolase
MGEAQDNDPPPVTVLSPDSEAPFVLVCEHASNYIPPRYRGLGLPASELSRHIAWDIGAGELTRLLSERLGATTFLSGASRLLIDCNRPVASATSIPEVSEIPIPGNQGVSKGERRSRIQTWFEPFHTAIARCLDAREAFQLPSVVVGVHSFTPVLGGVVRSMHAGVLYSASAIFGKAILADLRREEFLDVAENAPYRIDADDWTIPFHADRRSLAGVLLEVRNDEIGSPTDVEAWANRISRALNAGWRAIET